MSANTDANSLTPATPANEAIAQLVEQEGGRLYSLALRFCGNATEAEDLVQETFLQAFKHWKRFRGDAKPSTWLYQIASRACQRMHRKRSGEPERVQSLSQPISMDGPVPDLPGDQNQPLDAQLPQEARQELEKAIAALPTLFRMPLVLKEIVGFSVKEVATMLGLKEATVKTRLHRARLIVRDAMSEVLPKRSAPPPEYAKQVCMDLLAAKQDSLDRGVEFPMPDDFCERCRAVFTSMDLASDICHRLGAGELPEQLRQMIHEHIQAD